MAVQPAERQTTDNGRGSGDRVPFPPEPPASPEVNHGASTGRSLQHRVPYVWFLLPALVGYGAFFVYPTVRAFYLSLFDWTGVGPIGDFIGLRHFGELLHSDRFWSAALHSGQLFLFIFVFQNSVSLGLALMLNRRSRMTHSTGRSSFCP